MKVMNNILDSEMGQVSGWVTLLTAGLSGVIELVSQLKVDDTLQILLSIGGLIFLFYKIKNARLDLRIKKKQLNND